MEFNPRYVAYAASFDNTPERQLEEDRVRWPGGVMCGFILWISRHWTDFERMHAPKMMARYGDRELWRLMNAEAFDVWLQDKYRRTT